VLETNRSTSNPVKKFQSKARVNTNGRGEERKKEEEISEKKGKGGMGDGGRFLILEKKRKERGAQEKGKLRKE